MKKKIVILCSFLLLGLTAEAGNRLVKKKEMALASSPKYPKLVERFPYLEDLNFYTITYLSDSLKVNGFLITPKAEEVFPVVIYNRGGNRDYGVYNFKKLVQSGLAELAAQGYCVALSHYRGNGGSEGTEEFGGKDVNDVLELITALGEEEKADTATLGMYGWSRGGMMTYRALAKNHKINAVVIGGGVTNLYTSLQMRPGFEEEVYLPLIPNYTENKDTELKKRSAVYWVDQLPKTTPILLLHGGADGNVSPSQPLELAAKLVEHQIPYRLIIYEGENHSISNKRAEVQHEVSDWFNRFLVNKEPVPTTEFIINN